MCGIVGYTGRNQAVGYLLEGLRTLEYRGYDSAGVEVVGADHELHGVKCAGRVAALVTPEMARAGSEREREDISDVDPSGWGHNAEVDIAMPDGSTYHGYLYNRSHLLAKSLGGADAAENLVTGTRTQNVGDNRGQDGGMAYTEGLARDWLRENPDGTVYYSATPVYAGAELVARSVIVDVRSSDGALDLEVEVFNAASGYDIDYATGEFSVAGGDQA